MDANVLDAIRAGVGFELLGHADDPLMVCDFIQARDPEWVRKPFFAELNEDAVWFDQLRPAFGKEQFYFDQNGDSETHPLLELSEMLLD